jgi:hypothetical protein
MLRIWLALGIVTLASCAPVTLPGSGTNSASPTKLGSSLSQGSQPDTHFNANAKIDDDKSTALTNYLHGAQLPLVGARVLASNGGPRQAILYGYVGTPFGKADAVDKTREWLNDSKAQVDNRITIEPDLVKPSNAPGTATADNNDLSNPDLNNPDLQKYQEQQNREQARQQQQYMNQGSSYGGGSGMGMGFGGGGPLTMFLPLLMMGGGGSGMGFGMGGGGFGSPYGSSTSPYGSPYASPPYGSPYNSPYGSSPYPSYPSPGGPYGP